MNGNRIQLPRGGSSRIVTRLRRDAAVQALVMAASLRRLVAKGAGLMRTDGVALLLKEGPDDPMGRDGLELLKRLNPAGPFVTPSKSWFTSRLLADLPPSRVVLVGSGVEDAAIRSHLAAGGMAATVFWDAAGPNATLMRGAHVIARSGASSRTQRREQAIEAEVFAFALFHAAALSRPHAFASPSEAYRSASIRSSERSIPPPE